MQIFGLMILGLVAGILGGTFGIGGGSIMVPFLVILFGLTQHQAQGTSLAVMMIPIMIPAVFRYYAEGNVKIKFAIFIALGFILGAYLGANYVQGIPEASLKKGFGIFMIIMGIKMAFF